MSFQMPVEVTTSQRCMSSLVFLPAALCWWALKNNNNNKQICIAPWGRNFRGADDTFTAEKWYDSSPSQRPCYVRTYNRLPLFFRPLLLLQLQMLLWSAVTQWWNVRPDAADDVTVEACYHGRHQSVLIGRHRSYSKLIHFMHCWPFTLAYDLTCEAVVMTRTRAKLEVKSQLVHEDRVENRRMDGHDRLHILSRQQSR